MRAVAARIERVDVGSGAAPRRGVLLVLTDGEGRVGLGEATPLPGFWGADAEAIARLLAAAPDALGPVLPGGGDDVPARAVERAIAPLGPALRELPAAAFALETALLDLLGQRLGCSLAECLGGRPVYPEVRVNGLLSTDMGLPELLGRGRELVARGRRALKVKLRGAGDEGFASDLETLETLRRALPEGVELRLDPNAAWPEDAARARLAALARLAPRFVEQPVAADRLDRLGRCAAPWAADESLALPGMAERLLASGACAAFVLKPAALGLLRARALAAAAQARGLDVVVTHLFDGPVALAAACELALSLPRPPLACGLDEHAGLGAWPAAVVPQRRPGGVVAPSGLPGLGVRPWMA